MTYEQCLARGFAVPAIRLQVQASVPAFLVEQQLLLALKAGETIWGFHKAQVLTWMNRARIATGLLLNSNVMFLRDGITRFRGGQRTL